MTGSGTPRIRAAKMRGTAAGGAIILAGIAADATLLVDEASQSVSPAAID